MSDVGPIRLACCVPFCRRTFKNGKLGAPWEDGVEIICGKHWRLGSAILRRRHSRLQRLHTRGIRGVAREKVEYLRWLCFQRIKRQAIERAAGIA